MDPEMAAAAADGDPVAQATAIPLIAAQQQREALAAAQAAAAAAAAAVGAGSHQDSGSRGWGAGGRGSKGGRGGRSGRGRGSGAAAAWEVADTAGSREGAGHVGACFTGPLATVAYLMRGIFSGVACKDCLPASAHQQAPSPVTAGASSKRQRVLLPLRPYPQPWDAREVRCAAGPSAPPAMLSDRLQQPLPPTE